MLTFEGNLQLIKLANKWSNTKKIELNKEFFVKNIRSFSIFYLYDSLYYTIKIIFNKYSSNAFQSQSQKLNKLEKSWDTNLF